MKWVTRHRPEIDRVACPWFIKTLPANLDIENLLDFPATRLELSEPSHPDDVAGERPVKSDDVRCAMSAR